MRSVSKDHSFFLCLVYVDLLCDRLFELCREAVGSVIKLSMDSSGGENLGFLRERETLYAHMVFSLHVNSRSTRKRELNKQK